MMWCRPLRLGLLVASVLVNESMSTQAMDLERIRENVNTGVVGVICARLDSAISRLCEDLSLHLDRHHDLRVLGIMGKGSFTNIEDLMLLRGVDVAIAQADALEFYKRAGAFSYVSQVLRYITTVHVEEMHILAPTSISSIWDLEGKTVNFGKRGTGTFITASVVLKDLDISVNATTLGHETALQELKAGKIEALIKVDAPPVALFENAHEGFHFLEVPEKQLTTDVYEPSDLTSDDYPDLIQLGTPIPTVKVASVMAAYNWPEGHPRGDNVDKFVKAFFERIDELKEPGSFDPGWQDVDLTKNLPGWTRLRSAKRWLEGQQSAERQHH